MIKIITIEPSGYNSHNTFVYYAHGPYHITVWSDGNHNRYIDIFNGLNESVNKDEYEQYLKMDLELHKIYQGDEL